jgi:hypothetical protein
MDSRYAVPPLPTALPTSFAFGLTRRCASCPNDTHHRSFPRHRYSHRYTLPIYNGSTRFALPIPGCFRLIPELEKTVVVKYLTLKHTNSLGRVDNQQVQMKAAESATNDENRSESLS